MWTRTFSHFALVIMALPQAISGRTWSTTEGYNGYLDICLDESACNSSYTFMELDSFDEYDNAGARYHFDFDSSSTILNSGQLNDSNTSCTYAACTTLTSEVVLPNNGSAYAMPSINGDPYFRRTIIHVDSVADPLQAHFIGANGMEYTFPTALTEGDIIVHDEFIGWSSSSTNTLFFNVGIDTYFNSAKAPVEAWGAVSADYVQIQMGDEMYLDLGNFCFLSDGSKRSIGIGNPTWFPNYKLQFILPDSSYIQYVMRYANQNPSSASGSATSSSSTSSSNSGDTSPDFTSSSDGSSASTSSSGDDSVGAIDFGNSGSTSNGSGSNDSSSNGGATISAPHPASVLNLFSGGFEYCAAANCNIDDGVLSVALDRLGTRPVFVNFKELVYSRVVADFTLSDDLPFAPSILDWRYSKMKDKSENQDMEMHPLILEIDGKGNIHASKNSSALWDGPQNASRIAVNVGVGMLEKSASLTMYGDVITAPAGALRVLVTGYAPAGSSLSKHYVGLSFYLFALQDGKVITNITNLSTGPYSGKISISDMYIKYPTYGIVNGIARPINPGTLAYTTGSNAGMIQMVLELSPIAGTFSYEFFIGSNNIQYRYDGSWSSSSESEVTVGDPTYSAKDGKPVPTKLLVFPHGQFGLCFDTSCSTSVVKIGFTGLASSQGERLNRFVDAAAFVFSDPHHTYSSTGAELWSMSFTALVPQSRIRPPIPYDSSLASSYPTFSVRVDQYLAPGIAINSGQTLSVPRGALKFSFNISNWHFVSDTDKLVLNVTLSSILGDVPGSTKFNVTSNHNVMRLSYDLDEYLDIPLLAEFDGVSANFNITPVYEADVGVVLVMSFSKFSSTLAYDPVLASDSLVALDMSLLRSPAMYTIVLATGIALTVVLGVMIAISAVRCMRTTPVKIDFSIIVL